MNKLVLATGNQKKVKELAAMLADMKIQVIPQSEFAVSDADETGTTFVENAIIKARHADDPTPIICQASWEGMIIDEPRGQHGFGYDPVFFVPDHDCTSAQMPAELKNQLSHRGQALVKLKAALAAAH